MVKITIEIDNGTEPPRVIEINEKGTALSHENSLPKSAKSALRNS
jgi:hypothetical protein